MKMYKKLALVSAISMISAGAFAMEAMDDESMATTTGQDGITIQIIMPEFKPTAPTASYQPGADLAALNIATGYKGISIGEIRIHDDDGLARDYNKDGDYVDAAVNYTSPGFTTEVKVKADTTANSGSGAIVIGTLGSATDRTELFTNQSNPVVIDIDTIGAHTGSGINYKDTSTLNVSITTPTMQIKTGKIYVADSNADTAALGAGHTNVDGTAIASGYVADPASSDRTEILDSMTLTMGASTISVQLGHEIQDGMIVMDTVMKGGLSIDNFSIKDSSDFDNGSTYPELGEGYYFGGNLTIGTLSIKDRGGNDLTINARIDVSSTSNSAFTTGQLTNAKNQATVNAVAGTAAAVAITSYADAVAIATGPASALKATAQTIVGLVDAAAVYLVENEPRFQGTPNGLVIRSNLGSAGSDGIFGYVKATGVNDDPGIDISLNDIKMGDATAVDIGDVQILGMNMNGSKIIISGH